MEMEGNVEGLNGVHGRVEKSFAVWSEWRLKWRLFSDIGAENQFEGISGA